MNKSLKIALLINTKFQRNYFIWTILKNEVSVIAKLYLSSSDINKRYPFSYSKKLLTNIVLMILVLFLLLTTSAALANSNYFVSWSLIQGTGHSNKPWLSDRILEKLKKAFGKSKFSIKLKGYYNCDNYPSLLVGRMLKITSVTNHFGRWGNQNDKKT